MRPIRVGDRFVPTHKFDGYMQPRTIISITGDTVRWIIDGHGQQSYADTQDWVERALVGGIWRREYPAAIEVPEGL